MKTTYNNKVEFNGQTYMGDGEADFTNRVFPGWWGDASEGESYVSEWSESAIDKDGNRVTIIYQFDLVKGEEPEPENFDWDNNIVHVKAID